MPLPTDKIQAKRTFRQCAKDSVGTVYHQQPYALAEGTAVFTIKRAAEALEGEIMFPSRAALNAATKRGPVFHGTFQATVAEADRRYSIHWFYDQFGDCPFSALKSGNYRDANATEWGTQEVLDDCIDEVRRVLSIDTPVIASVKAPPPTKFGSVVRKLIL
jgi:hypothetical protein